MKIKRLKLTDSSVLYFLCILTPIIQIINSAFLFDAGESSFGKVFRLLVVIISFGVVLKTSRKQTKWISILTVILLFVTTFHIMRGANIFEALLNMMKFLSPYVLISAFVGVIEKRGVTVDYFDKILNFLTIFVPLSLIIPRILGLGYERYEGSGYQGLYFENNALVLVLIIIFIFSLENLFVKRNIKNILCVGLTTFSMIINGSKSSMAFFALVVVLYIFRYIFVQNPKQFPLRITVILVVFVILSVGLYPVISPLIESRIAAYRYYYTGGVLVNGGTVIDFLTNGRTAFMRYYFQNYYGNDSLLNIVFGIQSLTDIRVEMDIIDIFLYFGIIVVIVLAVYFLKAAKALPRCSFMIKLMFASIMVYSLLAGHVWNSSLAGLPFSLIIAIVMSENILKKNSINCINYAKYFRIRR